MNSTCKNSHSGAKSLAHRHYYITVSSNAEKLVVQTAPLYHKTIASSSTAFFKFSKAMSRLFVQLLQGRNTFTSPWQHHKLVTPNIVVSRTGYPLLLLRLGHVRTRPNTTCGSREIEVASDYAESWRTAGVTPEAHPILPFV